MKAPAALRTVSCRSLEGLKYPFLLLLLGMLTVSPLAFSRFADAPALQKLHLELMVTNRLAAGSDGGEVAGVAQLWIKTIGVSQGLLVETHTEVSNSLDLIRKHIDENKVDITTTSTLDYLNIDRPNLLEPVVTMSASQNSKGKIKYLLLTNKDAGITTLDGLRGMSVLTYAHADQELSRMWMEVLLSEHHLPPADKYFRSVTTTLKPSTACLPVFFHKADACIIDDSTWGVLKDLNGQVGAQLHPIAESPLLLEMVVSLHVNRKVYRAEILRGLNELPDSPAGRQVLLFFKAHRSYSIGRADLNEVVELRKAYLKRVPASERPSAMARNTDGESPRLIR